MENQELVLNDLSNELVILNKATIDKLFSLRDDSAIILYLFYYKTAKWQKTNQIYATDDYVKKCLNWGNYKITNTKNKLKEIGLIEVLQKRDDKKICGWYIKINFLNLYSKNSREQDVELPSSCSQETNAYNINNINALNNNIKMLNVNNNNNNELLNNKEELNNLKNNINELNNNKYKSIDYSNLYEMIEDNFQRTLNSVEYEYISNWEDNELTRYVIKETIAKCIYSVKYIDTTLNNYKNKCITTIQQAQEQERFYQKKKDEYNQKKYLTANERASMSLDEFVRRGEEEENKIKGKGK